MELRPEPPRHHPRAPTAHMSARPSHVAWPHREHNPKPQYHRPLLSTTPMSAHPAHVAWPHRGFQ
eukprot:4561446-Pyramimonas_sp.AAC.1